MKRFGARVGRLAFSTSNFINLAFFQKKLASKKIVWLFLFNIWLFLEAVGTYHQTGVLDF